MTEQDRQIAEDVQTLQRLGYQQELRRGMSAFSNFAISLSIICILAGGLTSFHVGLCSAGGASIGLGWPLVALFSLTVAATMGQVASAFPTAGGLYHWASILGGRGWGWLTAWLNLLGLITVLAAINAGTHDFTLGCIKALTGWTPSTDSVYLFQATSVICITASQGLFNHRGIRLTTRLTDFSGYLILVVAVALTVSLLVCAESLDFTRLVTFTNFSDHPPAVPATNTKPIFEPTANIAWLFCLSFLLPAYTLTGFDASAHTAEETIGAAHSVPRGIVRSVLVSGVFGWVMVCAIIVACPKLVEAADAGTGAFFVAASVMPSWLQAVLFTGIVLAQYLCGLAALTSASRMMFAFARDGGLPGSKWLKQVHAVHQTPVPAIWTVAVLTLSFVIVLSVYATIAAICAIFLYLSYVLPTALGLWAYGRTWTQMGPWHLGRWYRPLAVICVLGCCVLVVIGCSPPNEVALPVVGGTLVALGAFWFMWEKNRFEGPPNVLHSHENPGKIGIS